MFKCSVYDDNAVKANHLPIPTQFSRATGLMIINIGQPQKKLDISIKLRKLEYEKNSFIPI